MPKTISRYLSHQHAPVILLRFPRLLYLYFWLNHLSVLRMKYTRRSIRNVLRRINTPQRVLDAGCGMGDFLFTVPEFKQAEQIVGIDASASNIEVCRRLAEALERKNMHFTCSDLRTADIPPDQDLIICIAVLMYIEDDISLLKKFRESLASNGRLLLYVAVNYRRKLQIFKQLSKRADFDYDQIVGRAQTYTEDTLEQRLLHSGFVIEEKQFSFGTAAATMFEISSIFEWMFRSFHPLAALIILPLYLIFYPLYLFTMIIDYFGRRKTGNGAMIIARKQ